jgi:hypothetical protein
MAEAIGIALAIAPLVFCHRALLYSCEVHQEI